MLWRWFSYGDLTVAQVARDLGFGENILGNWVRQGRVGRGERTDLTTEERAELVRLRRENSKLSPKQQSVVDLVEKITCRSRRFWWGLLFCSGNRMATPHPPVEVAAQWQRIVYRDHNSTSGRFGKFRVYT